MVQQKIKRKLGKQSRDVSEKTKEAVLKAALKIFAREGFYNAKLREIADLAGTTHSLITHHFGSKYELYKAILDYGINIHEERLRRVIKLHKSDDSVELFKKLIASYIVSVAKNPEVSKIIMHNNSANGLLYDCLQEKKQLHLIVEPVFKRVQKCGYFKNFTHDDFLVYIHALVETPIALIDRTNRLLRGNILSRKGIAMHTERVLNFLFP
jgi:TetR/AcrR family transcriptional regulator